MVLIYRVQVPYNQGQPFDFAQDRLFEPLVSRKVAGCEARTEGNGTTKSGTDEQEPDTRHVCTGKQAHHCNAQKNTKSAFM
ncbi:hypothetical protein DHD05_18395 [Arenibacter sp. N53]|uniref:hypothetical protein n=1 Tax=Arenibacter TaxID=178469 RepID=UPI000CD3FDB6|nr:MULTISPECIES: hypothetical protein [Arenibacter]MCM4153568.1 hypothetical protein [Arenibacter sp. N53]